MRSIEISLGRTEPSRRVQTSGEWTSAWNAAVKAYFFVFPHRETELRGYGDYIEREFSAKVVSAHRRIILYDVAVRNEVGGGSSILLTDRDQFSYIYSAIVMPDGIESEHGRAANRSGTTKPQFEICRRSNSARTPHQLAVTNTIAPNAEAGDMLATSATRREKPNHNLVTMCSLTTADWSQVRERKLVTSSLSSCCVTRGTVRRSTFTVDLI